MGIGLNEKKDFYGSIKPSFCTGIKWNKKEKKRSSLS